MLHLKVLIKSLLHNKWITFIHAGRLAIAFTIVLLLSFYIKTESSVDKFHEQEKNIYRVLRDPPYAFSPPFADYVKEHVAGIKAYTRIKLLRFPYSFLKLEKKASIVATTISAYFWMKSSVWTRLGYKKTSYKFFYIKTDTIFLFCKIFYILHPQIETNLKLATKAVFNNNMYD